MAVMMTQSTPHPRPHPRLLPTSNMLYLHHEWIHQLMKGPEREREEKQRVEVEKRGSAARLTLRLCLVQDRVWDLGSEQATPQFLQLPAAKC